MSCRGEKYLWNKIEISQTDEGSNNVIDTINIDELKNRCLEILNNGIHGLCFSLYEDNQKPGDIISVEQVERRMNILKPHTQWIRSFSCIEGNEHIPKVAKKAGLNTLVGAWLSDNLDNNEKEIESLVNMAHEGLVDIAAVGNEVLYRNELSKSQLLQYLKRVKEAIPADIPVGYVDAYYEFTDHPDLAEACDVILSNCYPFWEGCPLEYSLEHIKSMVRQTEMAANGKKMIITETGWPSLGDSLKGAVANYENFLKYFINIQLWSVSHNIEVFYFSSFDESWKVNAEGEVGAYWGLWDKNEKLKF
ncbi:MAG TPA: glycosyl hydrolase family 17 protein [Saprospiraceae bacterium]|nr:glycosyl hydrolase [Saprospiraceae bacterium]MCB9328598.1 glycosyl hydrolase [Lewinellaceae bacterium]HRX29050.1 glycosyl hydrolase family 17 protein [Saprospiraceae bacterium]